MRVSKISASYDANLGWDAKLDAGD